MRTIKKLTVFIIAIEIVFSTIFIIPTVNADEIPLYDYSSFIGEWYDNDKGLGLRIISADENSITLQFDGEHFSTTYPIVGNIVTWDGSKRNWNISCSITFFDDSIYMVRNGVVQEAFREQYDNPEPFYDEYWFTSDTVRPHKIITGDYSIVLNGTKLEFDQPPVMCNDRILVPMRKIFEELGYNVEYYVEIDEGEEIITIKSKKSSSELFFSRLWYGDWLYSVNLNGEYVNGTLSTQKGDTPPIIINNRTLVPVRLVAEALGTDVEWYNETQTVIINTNK